MTFVPSHHDIVLCSTAFTQRLLDEGQLEAAVCQWLADPQRPLIDVLSVHARLSREQAADLESRVGKQAVETCVDSKSARMDALPAAVRRLFMPHVSDVTLA